MPHTLKNYKLEVHIDLPLEGYRHSRFDWTGKIIEVNYMGIPVSGHEIANQRENPLLGRGFYNEFGINSPLGYRETAIGDWFHKIGVGLLKKEESEYQFQKQYEIQPAEFNVDMESGKIRMTCQSASHNGYAYVLKKDIELLDDGFEVRYLLKNTGTKPIVTNEYNHNFLALNRQLLGKDDVLKFPFDLKPDLFDDTVNPEEIVTIGRSEIHFRGTPQKPFFFSNLSAGETVNAKWILENTHSKIGISEQGDFPTKSINLWGWGHVISPELFIELNIPAGQSKNWSRTYKIYNIKQLN